MAKEWYIVRVLTNREDWVRENIERSVKAAALEERIPEVLVPAEQISEIKNGKKKVVTRKMFPGYCVIQADLGDWGGAEVPQTEADQKVWFTLHESKGFGDFVGGQKPPLPMSPEEIKEILDRVNDTAESPRMAVKIKVGDSVRIKEGPFEGFDGNVEEIDDARGQLTISVIIFGRSTSVQIDHWHVEPN
ncbi:MAG: transcription termination/antitermination protein NusG [Planctomycetota bacterium]|nr:transcription termination/antitermination protein NusG [Planctomycetota bacterium]